MSAGAGPGRVRERRAGSRDALRVGAILVWSIVVWTALWGSLTVANVLWGAVLGALTLWLLPVQHKDHRVPVRIVSAARFALLFLWSLVKSSAEVAWEVVTPGSRINEGIVAVPLRTTSPGLITLLANAVSLTPGTLTLEVRHDPPTLYVHVLHVRDVEDVRADVHHLESVALAAFADADTSGPVEPADRTGETDR